MGSLASVAIDVSTDNGNSWFHIFQNIRPMNPVDTESVMYPPSVAGTVVIRATAVGTNGLSATQSRWLAVAKATQGPPSITPAVASITAGQSVVFSGSGGATGNYSWGGSASGNGGSESAAFPSPGTFTVTLVDTGNTNYSPSPTASVTVSVGPAFFTLSLSASSGGSVTGGGSYPPGAQATAVATPGPGSAFAGWTGDLVSSAPTVSIVMSANRSLLASFTSLLPQTISAVSPAGISTRSPAFAISASSTSGLPVALTLDSGPATLDGAQLTPSGSTGMVTVTATQPGNSQYLAAVPVAITFPIGLPPVGVVLSDDSAATKRSDRVTRNTSYTSGPPH